MGFFKIKKRNEENRESHTEIETFTDVLSWDLDSMQKLTETLKKEYAESEDVLKLSHVQIPLGRVSETEESLLSRMQAKLNWVKPPFPHEYIELIEKLVLSNPDMSMALELMIDLGNTGHHVEVVPHSDEVLGELEKLAQKLNTDLVINKMFMQILIGGAISVEGVFSKDGLEEIVFVPLKQIWFKWNEKEGKYEPYQRIGTREIKLNEITYKYVPVLTLDSSPYAIPPFLPALQIADLQDEIRKELKGLAKKIGLLGFLDIQISSSVLPRNPGETDAEYYERLKEFIRSFSEDVRENLSKGVLIHLDNIETEFKEVGASASGAKDLLEYIEMVMTSSLKIQPSLLGRTTGFTETWARIALLQFQNQIKNYQRAIRRTLEYFYKLHLKFKGYEVEDVNIKFNEMPSLDYKTEAEIEKIRVEKIALLYQLGIITLDEARRALGFGELENGKAGEMKVVEEEEEVAEEMV